MKSISRTNSYTAADALPAKLLQDIGLINKIKECKVISPVHVQFILTNRCNLKCDFCSCAEEDRSIEMAAMRAFLIIEMLNKLGTQAVTITGGGEPLMHPYFNIILREFLKTGISVGMVSNGLLFDKVNPNIFKDVTWCRISLADSRPFLPDRFEGLIKACPEVDWAFSYVVSPEPDIHKIKQAVEFASEHNFTHVRLVADLLQPDKVPMKAVEQAIGDPEGVKVIYQDRSKPRRGGDCYICYLKPVIGADEKVYTCCGAQYALDPPTRNMPKELCLGEAFELPKIIRNSRRPFNGSICQSCYYTGYNQVLEAMLMDLGHREFV